jgi:hypothetical protein
MAPDELMVPAVMPDSKPIDMSTCAPWAVTVQVDKINITKAVHANSLAINKFSFLDVT